VNRTLTTVAALILFSNSACHGQRYDNVDTDSETCCASDSATTSDSATASDEDAPGLTPPYNIILVGWDGVQRDHFMACFKSTLADCPDGLPAIASLSGGRIFDIVVTTAATETKPGWVENLTGYDDAALSVLSDSVFGPIPAGYSIFEKAEHHFGDANIATIFLAGKQANLGADCTTTPAQPWCEVAPKLDLFENGIGDTPEVGKRALEVLSEYKDQKFLAFVHFPQPDLRGHANGENSPQYSEGLVEADQWLARINDRLIELNIAKQTLIYVISDHGFDEDAKTHHDAPFTVLASNDDTIVRNGDRKDVAPTVLKKLGVSLGEMDGVPAVDGRPLDSLQGGRVVEDAN